MKATDGPMIVVSADCHIGPRLVEDLGVYCPPELRTQFDAYVADEHRSRGRFFEHEGDEEGDLAPWRNRKTEGHYDPDARRRDLDFDGVAAEVIFHGSQNDQPIPFQTSMIGPPGDVDLAAAGIRMYNCWLADVCASPSSNGRPTLG